MMLEISSLLLDYWLCSSRHPGLVMLLEVGDFTRSE